MKTIITVLIFISFSLNNSGVILVQNESNIFETVKHPCFPAHEKAKEHLKGYLEKDQNIEQLRNYGAEIDHTTHTDVYALKNESDSADCQKLIDNFEYLMEESEYSYSIYKAANHYFIVRYCLENNEFEWESTSIVNSDFEVVAVALNW